MRAGDRQHPALIDPLAQGLGSLEDRNSPFERLLDLWVVPRDRSADHEGGRSLYVARVVPLVYLYVHGAEPIRGGSRP